MAPNSENSEVSTDFFFVFGTVNVSVQQEWLSPTEQHYHTDLGLYIDKINPSDHYFKVCCRLIHTCCQKYFFDVMNTAM